MADGVYADTSEIDRLVADLGQVAEDAGKQIAQAVEITARKVKDDWREPLKGSSTLPALPHAVSYDLGPNSSLLRNVLSGSVGFDNTIVAEIGIDKDKPQGPLGNISEYGSPTVTGRGYGLAALEKNQGDFATGLEKATADAERKAGL